MATREKFIPHQAPQGAAGPRFKYLGDGIWLDNHNDQEFTHVRVRQGTLLDTGTLGLVDSDHEYPVGGFSDNEQRVIIGTVYKDGSVPDTGLSLYNFEILYPQVKPSALRAKSVQAIVESVKHITGREADPKHGSNLKAPGAKADAGKLRPTLVFRDMADALAVVVKIGTDGAYKYTDGGWLKVENGADRYEDADLRHMLKRFQGEGRDSDSQSLHLGHEAWNALAKLQLYLDANPTEKVKV